MTITGDLAVEAFLPWIDRHAAKLGLSPTVVRAVSDRIELDLSGPSELLDMLEIGCWLGPIDAMVEGIERRPL
ncbi:acylphosphatase [Aureimonas endophytica]|nr:acylphosphatase [Aureimonas endophytica]